MNNERTGYPQKYALMPIIKQVGWTNGPGWECERDYQIVAYVAMECYLLQEVITYIDNGTNLSKYLVVFAKSPEDFSTKVYPGDRIYGINTRGEFVNFICDTLEDAKIAEKIANKIIIDDAGAYDQIDKGEESKNLAINTINKYTKKAEQRRLKPKISTTIYI